MDDEQREHQRVHRVDAAMHRINAGAEIPIELVTLVLGAPALADAAPGLFHLAAEIAESPLDATVALVQLACMAASLLHELGEATDTPPGLFLQHLALGNAAGA